MVSMLRKARLIGAALVSLGCAAVADASVTITHVGLDTPGGVTGTLTYTPPNPDYSVNAAIGRLALTTSTGDTLLSYCVDLFDELKPGTFDSQAISAASTDPTIYGYATALLSHADPLATDANHSAAVQLALWEILYENTGSYSVGGGSFYASNISSGAVSIANDYLSKITNKVWQADPTMQLAVLTDSGNQTQLVFGASAAKVLGAVPEPATWAMMIVGFGAVGGAMRRRRGGTVSSPAL